MIASKGIGKYGMSKREKKNQHVTMVTKSSSTVTNKNILYGVQWKLRQFKRENKRTEGILEKSHKRIKPNA